MRNSLSAALAAALLVSGSAALFHSGSADAQVFDSLRQKQKGSRQQQQQQQQQPQTQIQSAEGQRNYNLSREEQAAIAPALQAAEASDWATAQTALAAAQSVARSADAKYLVGQIRLRIGIGTNNAQVQSQAIDELIASGGAQASELPALYRHQYDFATRAGDRAKAQRALEQMAALSPNDPNTIVQLAQTRGQTDPAGAIEMYQRAIQAQQQAGQAVPEQWRRQIVALAYRGRLPQAVTLGRELVAASPSVEHWRDALIIYRELGRPDATAELDLYRLMRAARALSSEADFVQYAEAAQRGAMFGEVKAVLEEGLGRNAITAANTAYAREMLAAAERRIADDRASLASERRTALAGSDGRAALRVADAFFGYGQYAEAAELYRAALRNGQDANLVNTRLGAALALAGQRTEAEAALRAVTGPRAELANFWLLWLSRRG